MNAEARPGLPYELLEGIRVVLLAAGASLIGYSAAFAYEAGLTGVLDLPITLISPQLTATVLATASLVITATVVVLGAELVIGLTLRVKVALLRIAIWDLLPWALFGLINAGMYQEHWKEWLWTFSPLLVLAVLDFGIVPLVVHRNKRSYRAKVLAARDRHWSQSMALPQLASRFGSAPFAILLFIMLFLYFAYVVGRSAGLSETRYLVTNDPHPTVVVRIYGNSIITESYDPRTMRPSDQFSVRAADSQTLSMRPVDIGHLASDCSVAIGCHGSALSGPIGLP